MDAKKTKQTTTTAPTIHTSIEPSQPLYVRMMQNFIVVWLDQSIDDVNETEYKNSITKLQEMVNTVNTFTNADECIHFITNIKTGKAFIISSGALGQTTVPVVHDMPQVNTIYIFCGNKDRHEQWAKQWPKIKGVFIDMKPICEALRKAVQECDSNAISMSFLATSDDAINKNLDQMDPSFVCTQILKEALLTINFEKERMKEFIIYCREQFAGNPVELKNIDKFEKNYPQRTPICWYTYQYFLYSMLDRALCTMEVDIIIKSGFFIRDLQEHITQLHTEQYAGKAQSGSFVVYRSQGLSQTDFDQLMKTQGGLLSFNQFLSTSKNREVSFDFVRKTTENSNLIGILFVMTIDSSILSTPFADIRNVSYYQTDEEILFSMPSIFRIEQIKSTSRMKRLWEVNLSLVSDNDPQLHALTEHIREEAYPHAKGWHRLGNLLIELNQFQKAQKVFEIMLAQTSDGREKADIYHMLGMVKNKQGEYAAAITFYQNSITINQKCLRPTHPNLASSYSCLGQMYETIGEYAKAFSSLEKTLEIQQKILPPNHPDLASSYSNMGNVFNKMGDYSKALSYYEKAHEIYQKTLSSNHPDLQICKTNLESVKGKF